MKQLTLIITLLMALSANATNDNPPPLPSDPDYFTNNNTNTVKNYNHDHTNIKNHNNNNSTSEGSNSSSNTTNDLYLEGDNTYYFTLPETANDHYGKGISCAKPTIGGGAYGDNSDDIGAFVGFSIPLNGKTCRELGKLRKQEMIWEAREAAAQRIRLCKMMHHSVTIDDNAHEDLVAMQRFCDGIKIEHNPPPKGYPEKERVSSHEH